MKNTEHKGRNHEDIKDMNLSLIIRLLQKNKICSRVVLAKESGLKQATITNIINVLIKFGLVIETGNISGEKGRRSIGITLNNDKYKIIGIRLQRKEITIGLFDICCNAYSIKNQFIMSDSSPEENVAQIKLIIDDLMEICKEQILAIGISLPGPYIKNKDKIAISTGNSGWEKIQFKEILFETYNLPVYIEQDANAGALAEYYYGKHNLDNDTLLFLAIGQGIGAGIVSKGQIFYGSMGFAGEIGHMSIDYKGPKCICGSNGCFELYCSTTTLIKNIETAIKNGEKTILSNDCSLFPKSLSDSSNPFSISKIRQAAINKDVVAIREIKKVAWFIGFGIVNLINIYNPGTIILGDKMTELGEMFLNEVKDTVKKHVVPEIYNSINISFSSFSSDPVLVGAVAFALDNILINPESFNRNCL